MGVSCVSCGANERNLESHELSRRFPGYRVVALSCSICATILVAQWLDSGELSLVGVQTPDGAFVSASDLGLTRADSSRELSSSDIGEALRR